MYDCDPWEEDRSFHYDSKYSHAVYQAWIDAEETGNQSAWLLTDYDTWIPNPNYKGPPNPPHPEYD